MKRLIWIAVGLPIAIVIIVLAVINRQKVTLNLDPFSTTDPAIALSGPLFVFLFATAALGLTIGGLTTWSSQRKWRRLAKQRRVDSARLRRELHAARAARPPATDAALPVLGPAPGERAA